MESTDIRSPSRQESWTASQTNTTDLPLFQDANHLPQYKCFSHPGDLVARLLTGDSRIEWNGRIFQPASAAYDYITPDGIGNHTEWWMTEVTS